MLLSGEIVLRYFNENISKKVIIVFRILSMERKISLNLGRHGSCNGMFWNLPTSRGCSRDGL